MGTMFFLYPSENPYRLTMFVGDAPLFVVIWEYSYIHSKSAHLGALFQDKDLSFSLVTTYEPDSSFIRSHSEFSSIPSDPASP